MDFGNTGGIESGEIHKDAIALAKYGDWIAEIGAHAMKGNDDVEFVIGRSGFDAMRRGFR
jgi:hypothetical protein